MLHRQTRALINPITRAEYIYQSRSAPQQGRWRRNLIRFALVAAFTLALILGGGEFAGALLHRDPDPISRFFGPLNLIPVTTAILLHFILLHFILLLRTLSLSANSIARERQHNNWDMLVLTGVNARQIIRGKWWATLRRMWRAYLLLAVLRAAVIIWMGASVSRVFVYGFYYGYNYSYYGQVEIIAPSPLHFLLAAGVVFLLTMINLPFTAACGVAAITARSSNSALLLMRAIGIRVLVLLGFSLSIVGFTALVWSHLIWSYDYTLRLAFEPISELNRVLATTFVDNGFSAGSQLLTYHEAQIASRDGYALTAAFISLVIYVVLTWLLLRLAQWQAVRQNALPPLPSASPNPATMM